MDDPRPQLPAHVREAFRVPVEVMEQGIDQRAAADPCAQVDHHPGGLVECNYIVILIEDFERYRFRVGAQRRRRLRLNPNPLAPSQPVAGLDCLRSRQTFDPGFARMDQLLDAGARQQRKPRSQEQVQALAAVGFTGGKNLPKRHDNPQITQITQMILKRPTASSLNSAQRFQLLTSDF